MARTPYFIHNEGLCPSSGDINRLMMMMIDDLRGRVDEGSMTPVNLGMGVYTSASSAIGVEQTLSALRRREGELRSLTSELNNMRRAHAALRDTVARLTANADHHQSLQEQYDALLQMYGEKEEQLSEAKLDLHDVTQLYKAQLDELVLLKRQVQAMPR
ncbi:hypothetical protein evm_012775 [Chilo suppressalis]|nr:hypothetical protein evm_012775 [Chilo suppressalis]